MKSQFCPFSCSCLLLLFRRSQLFPMSCLTPSRGSGRGEPEMALSKVLVPVTCSNPCCAGALAPALATSPRRPDCEPVTEEQRHAIACWRWRPPPRRRPSWPRRRRRMWSASPTPGTTEAPASSSASSTPTPPCGTTKSSYNIVAAQPKGLLGQNRPCAHLCVQGTRESNFSPILVRQEELDQLK